MAEPREISLDDENGDLAETIARTGEEIDRFGAAVKAVAERFQEQAQEASASREKPETPDEVDARHGREARDIIDPRRLAQDRAYQEQHGGSLAAAQVARWKTERLAAEQAQESSRSAREQAEQRVQSQTHPRDSVETTPGRGIQPPQPARTSKEEVERFRAETRKQWELEDAAKRREREKDPYLLPPVLRIPEAKDLPSVQRVKESELSVRDATRERLARKQRETAIQEGVLAQTPAKGLRGYLPGAAGAAGGPVAGALGIADQAGKAIATGLRSVGEAARVAADSMTKLASNDNLGAVKAAADGVASALGKIPIVGQVAEAAIKTFGTVVKAGSDVVDAFVKRGKELSIYSPQLTVANVRADIRSLMADIKEAQTLGEPLAKLTDAQSRLAAEFREILLPIKKVIVELLVDVLQYIRNWIQDMKDTASRWEVYFKTIYRILEGIGEWDMEKVGQSVVDAMEELRDIQRRREERDKKKDMDTFPDDMLQPLRDARKAAYARLDHRPGDVILDSPRPPANFVPGAAF